MATLRGLMREAGQSARWRGHTLARWLGQGQGYGAFRRVTACKRCGRSVVVTLHPMPNDIEVSGGAVAQDCEVRT